MQLRVENKARLAIVLFILALIFAIALSLSLYAQAQQEIATQQLQQFKLQALLLTALLTNSDNQTTEENLKEMLVRNGISGSAEVRSPDGQVLLKAVAGSPASIANVTIPSSHNSQAQVFISSQNSIFIAQSALKDSRTLLLLSPQETTSSHYAYSIFIYQIVALLGGLLLIYFLVRWLLSPYRRMVKVAQGSPVRATSAKSESEFVVETFQALIEQLQNKEAELARLHALEKSRAEKSERFSERLIANIPSGLVSVDARGMITTLNGYGENLLMPSTSGIIKRKTGDLEFPVASLPYQRFFQAAPKIISMIAECLASGTAFKREEVEISQSDGRLRKLGMSISPIVDAQQRIEGALCMMTDITEVTELRERIKIQETMANLGEMAAGLAHEFKNSLATIQGYAQLLDSQNAKDDSTRNNDSVMQNQLALMGMLKEVNLLSRLVTDFLNFARPQRLNLSEVELEDLLKDCLDEVHPLLEQNSIDIQVSSSYVTIFADESLLRRAFVNLIRNAAEAIDTEAEHKHIRILFSVDPGSNRRYVHIRVIDTGSGIPAESLPNIFIPFFTTKSRGYGIGLAIVQKIIVAHGGDVTVERSDATGTVFYCRLPILPPTYLESAKA
jgi:signal transduction histidine kinase